ncbi:MAG: GTP-binding protein [Sphaerochaetaceae bacterium]|mgnify:CR=1 FL=1|jgi:G3E family GTPase|nr:GTP-binding protein [Sphaerochaetaceae bacterium]NLO60772.1 GTP-binding protein [Spirochaetales bacterium]MDD3670656.1 GTP-binding protein [Sphaerochaetaceae bacterium]MDD4259860.1 GTP-binding protein [Sphaerochaetaceae bacterium]MDD5076690.1 GTP-binding protein [Sphaerochaetaceae bacterium]
MTKKQIPLILVTGFLGSGKTSLINAVLKNLDDKRIALLLNDFGSMVIDRDLIESDKPVVQISALNGGQIFCSCLSGSFVKQTIAMAALDIDMIIVETSGLAKPSTLVELTTIIEARSEHVIFYAGMLCVIDAVRYRMLSTVVGNLNEQIVYSDMLIINKTDLVDANALVRLESELKRLVPAVPMIRTVHCDVPFDIFTSLRCDRSRFPKDVTMFEGWGTYGRPSSYTFLPKDNITLQNVQTFAVEVSPSLLRLKGFLPMQDGTWIKVDAVGSQVDVSNTEKTPQVEPGLVALFNPSFDGKVSIETAWEKVVG